MKIGVAQTRPVTGDIQRNLERHAILIDMALHHGAKVIVFPELSVTGYEPSLAKDLAIDQEDARFDIFQHFSDTKHATIGVGAPTASPEGPCISLLIFQPHKARELYSKMHLHQDEEPFFARGKPSAGLFGANGEIALAICYELSVAEHAASASKNGAEIYIASVAKPAAGVDVAANRLSEIAREYSMMALMSNCVGPTDGWESAGRTSVWDDKGVLLSQLDDKNEGILVVDTETHTVVQCIA